MADKGAAGTDLVVRQPIGYAITEIETNELVEIIQDNLAGESIGPNDLDRLTVPTGGSKFWTVKTQAGEENPTEIEGVIIAQKTTRVYWEDAFSGAGSPPDCSSDDGEFGIGNPGGACAVCPMAEFGSKGTGGGRAQACKQNKLLFIVFPDEILPRVISVPPTSLKEARQYTLRSLSARQPLYGVTTKLSLEKTKNADGIEYSKIQFATGSVLNDEDRARMKAYADQMSPILKKVRSDDGRSAQVIDLDDTPGDDGEPVEYVDPGSDEEEA